MSKKILSCDKCKTEISVGGTWLNFLESGGCPKCHNKDIGKFTLLKYEIGDKIK